jgi:hypothetical protein
MESKQDVKNDLPPESTSSMSPTVRQADTQLINEIVAQVTVYANLRQEVLRSQELKVALTFSTNSLYLVSRRVS